MSLTSSRKEKNEEARRNDEEMLFNPSIPKYDEIDKYFRVFVNDQAGCKFLAYRRLKPTVSKIEIELLCILPDRALKERTDSNKPELEFGLDQTIRKMW